MQNNSERIIRLEEKIDEALEKVKQLERDINGKDGLRTILIRLEGSLHAHYEHHNDSKGNWQYIVTTIIAAIAIAIAIFK